MKLSTARKHERGWREREREEEQVEVKAIESKSKQQLLARGRRGVRMPNYLSSFSEKHFHFRHSRPLRRFEGGGKRKVLFENFCSVLPFAFALRLHSKTIFLLLPLLRRAAHKQVKKLRGQQK